MARPIESGNSMTDYGWNAHVDKTGTPCAYCDEPKKPSTHTLVLEADQYANHALKRRGKRVGVCDEHIKVREDAAAAVTFRRRKNKDVEQLSMDVGDGQRGNAIYGNEAP